MTQDRIGGWRLGETTSPYLHQHAGNPVEWYPWGEEALDRARREDKPIHLSIGYSACHWCHVMARESFSDPAIAERLNRDFVNIKVDREERPDLDRAYQTAHQLLTGRGGGWPLTVFLAPDQTPFFAATYFPPTPRQGMPGFADVLAQIRDAWQSQGEAIAQQNAALHEALADLERPATPSAPGVALLGAVRRELGGAFDRQHGGFGGPPKFPQPTFLRRLFRHYARSLDAGRADRDALHMACHTLRRMALGGIYDQVGGGFARYAVDQWWMIPHFEKMLGDNGQLLSLYALAYDSTGDELFRRVALETADWLRREMRAPGGAFHASLDADSEGREGAFYVWTPDAIRDLLPADQAEVVVRRFGLDEKPNFEGRWHFHVHAAFSELAREMRRSRGDVVALWERARATLITDRDRRPHPHRDEKILTAWNALAARGLADAARALDAPELAGEAWEALDFLHGHLWDGQRLAGSWLDGRIGAPGFLDDHAFTLDAVLAGLQAHWRPDRLDWARALADALIAHFEDSEHGGFHFTADDHEALIHRPRSFSDDATPSGAAIAAQALRGVGDLLGESRFLDAADRAVRAGTAAAERQPLAHAAFADAVEDWLWPPARVLIRADERNRAAWRQATRRRFRPAMAVYTLPASGETGLAEGSAPEGEGARVCAGHVCQPRCNTPDALADTLDAVLYKGAASENSDS